MQLLRQLVQGLDEEPLAGEAVDLYSSGLHQHAAHWTLAHRGLHFLCGNTPPGQLDGAVRFLAIIGDPVNRAANSYRHILKTTNHPLHRAARDAGSIGAFYSSKEAESLVNRQAKAVLQACGIKPSLAAERLEDVLAGLLDSRFCWLGVEEDLPRSLVSLEKALSREGVPLRRALEPLQAKGRPHGLTDEEEETIRTRMGADVKLYERALRGLGGLTNE
jgi:hypothetical protein